MSKKTIHLDEIGNKNPFKVPEGYFEGLTDQIMSQLPEKVQEETVVVSLWDRVKPWVYMAAMFGGIALMIKVFVGTPQKEPLSLELSSSVEIEDFYNYYEEQALKNMYSGTYYAGFDYDFEE